MDPFWGATQGAKGVASVVVLVMEVMRVCSRGMAKKEVKTLSTWKTRLKASTFRGTPANYYNNNSYYYYYYDLLLVELFSFCLAVYTFWFLAIGPPQLVLTFISRLRMTRNRKI